ncbi:coiled-coil domain-containing protein 189 isoform X2 [Triplophysa rosa]|uniref:coiled-coil domain-containing protein 189 isoform X2 n=1 Tax=Triplophysa rosa TaxID=992332 RepID=UPI00254631EB|nr:coiled-coil domain-containing protein 189 isoform X2 [Triplophysa rosa]
MKPFEEIRVPQPPRARVLLWADLKQSDLEELERTKSIPEIERILCRALVPDVPEPKRRILLELYTNQVLLCKEKHFNREQTSVLISIVKNVHQFNTETPLNNTDHCFNYCSELLLCHSVRRPPFSIDLFNADQVTEILTNFINTYIRHYFLYKYIFTPEVHLDLSLSYVGIPELTGEEEIARSDDAREFEREIVMDEDQQSAATPIMKTTETDNPKQGSTPKSEVRTIVQKEVREEVMRLNAQLQKRLQESAEQLNGVLSKLEANIQVIK